MPYSVNKLNSHMLFTCKSFMFFDFTWKKNFFQGNGGVSRHPPFLYGPGKRLMSKLLRKYMSLSFRLKRVKLLTTNSLMLS